MSKQAAHKIIIIGCGNVAWHLATHLRSLNHSVLVYNHGPNPALKDFEKVLKCKTAVGLTEIDTDADFYFVCVSDSVIAKASKNIHCDKDKAVVAHTSGSTSIKELKNSGGQRAVFYPLQTFSKNDTIQWDTVPLVIETEHDSAKKLLGALAQQFSKTICFLDHRHRLKLHLAAVFVNNFTNTLYAAAIGLISKNAKDKDFELLLPLIRQTTAKLEHLAPLAAQTGPAKRGDKPVMEKHLGLLSGKKDLEKLYKQLSKLIVKQQSHA